MRGMNGSGYRYGFQGQEKDDEIKGEGLSVNYKYRMHDPRLGRFFAVDPLAWKYSYNSPYAFSENRVVDGVELEGLEFSKNGYHSGYSGMDGINISTAPSNGSNAIFIANLKRIDDFLDGPGGGAQGGGIHMMASFGSVGSGVDKLATALNTDYTDDYILALLGATGGSADAGSKYFDLMDKAISVKNTYDDIKSLVSDAFKSRFGMEGKEIKNIVLKPSIVLDNVKVVVEYADGSFDSDQFNLINFDFPTPVVGTETTQKAETNKKASASTVVENKVAVDTISNLNLGYGEFDAVIDEDGVVVDSLVKDEKE